MVSSDLFKLKKITDTRVACVELHDKVKDIVVDAIC